MAFGPQIMPAGIEEARFKRVEEGWLFTAAHPCIVGPVRTYLIDDALKPALAAAVRRAGYLRVILMVPLTALFIAAMILEPAIRNPISVWAWIAFALFVLSMMMMFAVCERLTLHGLLAGAQRSGQKIDTGDRLRAQASAMSFKALSVLATLSLFLVVSNFYRMRTAHDAMSRVTGGMGAATFALFAGWLVVTLVIKSRRRRDSGV